MLIRVIGSGSGNQFAWSPPETEQELTSPVLHASAAPLVYVQIVRDGAIVSSGYVGTGRHGGAADFHELDATFANVAPFTDILIADRFEIGDSILIEAAHGDEPLDAGYWWRNLLHH